jgi:hypothetical protein
VKTTASTIKPLFTKVDGELRMTPAAMLLAAAARGFCLPGETPAQGAARGSAFVREMLVAARDGGFMQSEVLETVLAQPLPNRRAVELAQAACACIAPDDLPAVFMRMEMAMGGLGPCTTAG